MLKENDPFANDRETILPLKFVLVCDWSISWDFRCETEQLSTKRFVGRAYSSQPKPIYNI